ARGVIRIPADRLSSEARRRLARLMATLLQHPEPQVRFETLGRLQTLPIYDTDRVLLPRIIGLLGSRLPDEVSAAARALFDTYTTEREAGLLGGAVGGISGNRRALNTVVAALQAQLARDRGRLLPATWSVLGALEHDAITSGLRVELAVHALPWEELVEMLTRLAASGELHAEALMAGVETINHVTGRGRFYPFARSDTPEIGALESALARSGDERLRRVALAALVALSKPPRGWDEGRLEQLRAYRADPSTLVASAAQFTLPAEELS
ncbi:MAG: hypothetical protein M3P51_19210, partial [Chloroflexota bacterium]|nr:hypothetical protein [Chloroflexota bacterium]